MPKSQFALEVDGIQKEIRCLLKPLGFRVRGRTFNRESADGLTEVINFQMGPSEPPGVVPIPGLRENLHGLFTVNLGVYCPEVARRLGTEAGSWVQEYFCCVRARLGRLFEPASDLWWPAKHEDEVTSEVRVLLEKHGVPFLERYNSRARILSEWDGVAQSLHSGRPPRIVCAILRLEQGDTDEARRLLAEQASTDHKGHAEYVRQLAQELGIGFGK